VKNTQPSPRCSGARNAAALETLNRITLPAAPLIDSAQILVQPREDILNKFGSPLGDIVRSVKFHVAFVGWWSAKHFEQRILSRFHGEDVIKTAIHHHYRLFEARGEIGLIATGGRRVEEEAAVEQDHRF